MLSKPIIKALTSLKQGYSKHLGKAPHKPVLLLAVFNAIEKGHFLQNRITIDLELIGEFRGVWNVLVKTGHTPNFALPLELDRKGYSQNKPIYDTRKPLRFQFDLLLEQGLITMDHLISRKFEKGFSERGSLFKIEPYSLELLFPSPLFVVLKLNDANIN